MLVMSCFLSAATAAGKGGSVFVASTSVQYPYERGQWSRAEGEKWVEKYGPIVGVNHPAPPSPAVSQEECVKHCKELGFNSIRMFLGGGNAAQYINNVESWAAMCHRYGLTLAPVFNFPWGFYGRADKEQALKDLETMVRPVIQHFRGDERVIMWDIWNEPTYNNATTTPELMDWIAKMVVWCRQEGCTQAITSSIIWDSEIRFADQSTALFNLRNKVEGMMDLHNFHDYAVQEQHSLNTAKMVERIGKIDDRPLICTECMTRVYGSDLARSLTEYSKYGIGFYTWGLHNCDANWEVKWDRSTFYAYEPVFHNLLFMDGDAIDQRDLDWVKNFHYAQEGEKVDPGAEWTENWTARRAWKWMTNNGEKKGLAAASVSEANALLKTHATDSIYNSIAVKMSYSGYCNNATNYYNEFSALLSAAKDAGMTVMPILTGDADLAGGDSVEIGYYCYNVILKYYNNSSIEGWNLYQSDGGSSESLQKAALPYIMRYARYAYPCQPMFMAPAMKDAEGEAADLIWRMSDVVAFNANGTAPAESRMKQLAKKYSLPLFCTDCAGIGSGFADCHVNWYTTANSLAANEVKDFQFQPDKELATEGRWDNWRAWSWMNRKAVKGLSFEKLENALAAVKAMQGTEQKYNSIRVLMDLLNYRKDSTNYKLQFDSLVDLAGKAGMTVMPTLLNDRNLSYSLTMMKYYFETIMKGHLDDSRILAWELVTRPGTNYTNLSKMNAMIPQLFELARGMKPVQPLFVTPKVNTQAFASDFDHIAGLVHGKQGGWNKLTSYNVSLTYKIWCLSDVIAYYSNQPSAQLGWLNSVANKFGRPLFCRWEPSGTEETAKTLAIFRNMHVNWFVDGTVSDTEVEAFGFDPIITNH